ncbi:hypothetical protein [Actinomadura harenae]|uniref:hypothetical protein n=1 Tax=Actinomadura harenae TaxID=2483351 RepID=UPI0018F6B303|nr:hypothetical protein [Actinomadura harenae]
MALRGLYIFTHHDVFGIVPAQVLFDLITAKANVDGPTRAFREYDVKLDESGIPDGVTLTWIIG